MFGSFLLHNWFKCICHTFARIVWVKMCIWIFIILLHKALFDWLNPFADPTASWKRGFAERVPHRPNVRMIGFRTVFGYKTQSASHVLTVSCGDKHVPASTDHPRRQPSTRRHVRISQLKHAHLPDSPYRSKRRRTHPPYRPVFRDCPAAGTALNGFHWRAVRFDTAWTEAIDTLPVKSWF